jgi:hypothetical protein
MRRVCFALFLLLVALPTPVLAQSEGGGSSSLNVCCGGSVSYVGGSGSISGTVRGPAGRPARQAPAKPAAEPSAVTGGKVEPAVLPELPTSQLASDTEAGSWRRTAVMIALAAIAVSIVAVLGRRRPEPRRRPTQRLA